MVAVPKLYWWGWNEGSINQGTIQAPTRNAACNATGIGASFMKGPFSSQAEALAKTGQSGGSGGGGNTGGGGSNNNGVQIKHLVVNKNVNQWYVLNTSPASGTPTIYTVAQGTYSQIVTALHNNFGGYSGPYNSLAKANQVAANEPPNKAEKGPYGTTIQPGGGVTVNPGTAAVDALEGWLGGRGLWVRIAEVGIGAALVIVGVSKLAGNTQIGKAATKIGTKVGLL